MLPFLKNDNQSDLRNISTRRNTIFMSNHISIEDASILHTTLPENVRFVLFSKEEYAHNERALKSRNCTVFEQLDGSAIKETIKLAESGEPLLLFPENRVSTAGIVMRILPEIAFIAFKSDAVIYPIIIKPEEKNTQSFIKYGLEKLDSIVPVSVSPKSKPNVYTGNPFTLSSSSDSSKGDREKEKMAQTIYKKLTELQFNSTHKKGVNLFNELLKSAKTYDEDKHIVKDLSSSMNYSNLILTIHVLSQRIEQQIKDKRVGVLLPTSIGHVVTLFSLFKIGITPAILNFTMGEQNLLDCCETAELKTILTSKEFIEKGGFEELIRSLETKCKIVYLEDIKKLISTVDKLVGLKNNTLSQKSNATNNELILFTSGSEAKPKGVILTHDNIMANIQQALTVIDINGRDNFLNSLPMFHSFGLTVGSLLPIVSGIPVFLHPSPIQYKTIPQIIYKEDITFVIGTPTFLNGYESNTPDDYFFRSLRYVIAGAEKLKEETKETWIRRFGIRIIEGYGATEASPILSLNTPLYKKAESVGQLLPGIQYKVEPVEGIESGGKLLVKGPNFMKGYLIHEKGFIPLEDWYDTGDVVEVDDMEYITIKSRLKRFAKIGGEMVSLNLVEEVAIECFGQSDLAAVSIPDKKKGEKIVLFVTKELPKEGILSTHERVFKKHLKARKLSPIMTPADFIQIESIPLLGSGKTDYVTLTAMAQEKLS